jgi:hypothetical protein
MKILNKEEELKKLKEKALTDQNLNGIFGLQELHGLSDEEVFLQIAVKYVELADGYLKILNDLQKRKK